jgi:hypothetical protein
VQWQANEGKFKILDAKGEMMDTDLTYEADKWHKVIVTVDVQKKEWKLKVDENEHPKALAIKGAPPSLSGVSYSSDAGAGAFLDAIQIMRVVQAAP